MYELTDKYIKRESVNYLPNDEGKDQIKLTNFAENICLREDR